MSALGSLSVARWLVGVGDCVAAAASVASASNDNFSGQVIAKVGAPSCNFQILKKKGVEDSSTRIQRKTTPPPPKKKERRSGGRGEWGKGGGRERRERLHDCSSE